MSEYTTDDIRNLVLVGHGGSGKTTLAEALLLKAGAIDVAGEVANGTTVSDFDAQEIAHQSSLYASLASFEHAGKHVNVIDTPGYPDFLGRSVTVLPAVETAVVVIDARSGVQMTTRRMMEAAAARRMCRMIVVNKIDAEGVDLEAILGEIVATFGAECLPLNLPAGGGTRIVDCFFEPGDETSDFSSVEEAHTQMVDQSVEVDDELMELYLEQGEDLAPERLRDAFQKALRDGHLIPVCFTSIELDVGVAKLMRVITELLPSPIAGNRPRFLIGEGQAAERFQVEPDPTAPVVAHVFKVAIDPFVGKLGFFRIHAGTVTKDSQLYVSGERKPSKVGHLFAPQGKDNVEVTRGVPGDIRAVSKMDAIRLDCLLREGDEEDGLRIMPVERPAPMHGLAIEAKTHGDEQKISDSLNKLAAEDPCFVVEHNPTLNETVIRGLSDLHLRIVLERLKDRYNVEVETRPPRIAYRETIRVAAEGHHRHKKQTGGAGQFGEVYLRVEPLPRGSGFEFVDKIVGGVIPNGLIPAVEKGVRQVIDGGAIAGYPMQDIRVTLHDGKYHPVDSKEVAFVAAGKKAFLDAVGEAKPIVLEPIVDIEVTVPAENMGDITGDLASKRGRISGTTTVAGGMLIVSGQAPLSELGSYQSELKSVTGGAGSFTMELSHYDPVPAQIQKQLIEAFKPSVEED